MLLRALSCASADVLPPLAALAARDAERPAAAALRHHALDADQCAGRPGHAATTSPGSIRSPARRSKSSRNSTSGGRSATSTAPRAGCTRTCCRATAPATSRRCRRRPHRAARSRRRGCRHRRLGRPGLSGQDPELRGRLVQRHRHRPSRGRPRHDLYWLSAADGAVGRLSRREFRLGFREGAVLAAPPSSALRAPSPIEGEGFPTKSSTVPRSAAVVAFSPRGEGGRRPDEGASSHREASIGRRPIEARYRRRHPSP